MLTVINPTQTIQRTARTSRLLAFGAALLLPLVGAFAQNAIPDEMVLKQEISAADGQIIRSYVEANTIGPTGTAAEVKKSRDALVAPVEKPGVTVPFRVAYAKALIEHGKLKELAASKDNDLVAANALRVAGQAATGTTLSIILDGLKDTRPQVRYAAAVAARAAFTAARTNPALSGDELTRAMKALGDVAATDTAKEPVDGALQALIAAREVANNRSPAIEQLTTAAGKRALVTAKSDQADALAPLLRVAATIRQDMTDAGQFRPEARKGAAAFAGQLLVAIGGQWKEGTEPSDAMMQAAKAAEAILALVDENLQAGHKFTIGRTVAPGKRDEFNRELDTIVKLLQAEPYSVPAPALKP